MSTQEWDAWPARNLARWARLTADPETAHGTVCLMVRDGFGNIASGVSTSGWAWKYPGRVGDSPVIGAGNYADNRYGAVSCTGFGEMAIRAGTARSTVLYAKMGLSIAGAVRSAIEDLDAATWFYKGGVTIYAFDRHEEHHVARYSRTAGADCLYQFWSNGMAAPEQRQGIVISASGSQARR
jgi:L-asparaginase